MGRGGGVDAQCLSGYLPPLMTKTRTPRQRTIFLSPREFLRHIEFGIDFLRPGPTDKILVDGDLVISENDNLLTIPEARVTGFASIRRCLSLSSCSLKVDRELRISDCPSLNKIMGSSKGLWLERVGCGVVGADFDIDGDLNIIDCPQLTKINSCVRGGLIVSGSLNLQAGPAFLCGENSMVNGVYSKGNSCLPRQNPSRFIGPSRERKSGR